MLSTRSKLSLLQLLMVLAGEHVILLLEKHLGVRSDEDFGAIPRYRRDWKNYLLEASEEQVMGIADEVVRTNLALRVTVNPHYIFDQRWDDFARCLSLDSYTVKKNQLVSIDASSNEQVVMESELTKELQKAGLEEGDKIRSLLNNSAENFRKSPPDYNGCLNSARVALETLAKTIAVSRATTTDSFDASRWGQVIFSLRASGFLSEKEERVLAGIFSFVSEGSHTPLGFSEQEYVRLGRVLVLGMCYFLVKRLNK